jgi:hypothetical protein
VLSRKRKARFAVICSLAFALPVDKSEVDSVVIGVASSALFAAGAICPHPKRMHATMLRDSLADLGMTFKTFQLLRTATQAMTLAAVCRS